MFLSHINLFIITIAFILFVIRLKNQSFSENLLVLFTGLTFISSSLWLYVNYYNENMSLFIDYFGLINENILLVIGIFFVCYLGKTPTFKTKVVMLVSILCFSLILFSIHLLLAKNSDYIIYPTNENIQGNLLFQVIVDIVLYLVFLIFFFKKKQSSNKELFDGRFRKYTLLAFSFYCIQDLLILVLLFLTIEQIIFPDILKGLVALLNVITSFFLLMTAIYTNWLKEFNLLRMMKKNEDKIIRKGLTLEDLENVKQLDWNGVVNTFKDSHQNIITTIDLNDQLSKTEKLYAFLDQYEFSNKDISRVLCVSVRTVETNFYRMRLKLRSQ